MAVTLISTGGLFPRVGAIGGRIYDVVAITGGSATLRTLSTAKMTTNFDALAALYAETTAIKSTADGLYQILSGWQSAQSGFYSSMTKLASDTIIRMVHEDNPLPQKTLELAMKELIRQMTATSDSVNATELSAGSQTAVGSPTGTIKWVTSMKNGKGVNMEYIFPETLKLRCTADAQTGGATAGQESFVITGKPAALSSFAYDFPQGSGASYSISAVDAEQNNDGKNLLYTSSFESWCSDSANTPQNWTVAVGTAGTTVYNGGSGDAYDGTGVLKLTGDGGGTLSRLTQEFDHVTATTAGNGGTPAELLPETPYCLSFWYKVSATPTAGVLTAKLVDSGGSTISDSASTANSTTQSLTAATTSWAFFSTTFRLPAVLPTLVKLSIGLSTAIDSGKSVFIDRVALTPMKQLYTGGPYAAVFSGATDPVVNDSWTTAITASSVGTVQRLFDQLFNMRSLGLQLPSVTGGGETVADSVVS